MRLRREMWITGLWSVVSNPWTLSLGAEDISAERELASAERELAEEWALLAARENVSSFKLVERDWEHNDYIWKNYPIFRKPPLNKL